MTAEKSGQRRHARALPALNGLRGLASCVVMVYHAVPAYGHGYQYGFGVNGNFGLHQLPLVRLLHDGSSMVLLFYIISGYLLYLKPMGLIKQGKWDQAFQSLSSSIFRRPLRLLLPALITSFSTMIMLWLGFFEYTNSRSKTPHGTRHTEFEILAPRLDSFWEQLTHWFWESITMMNPFTWDRKYNPYNPHFWTLTAELRASYIGFIAILTLARLVKAARLFLLCVMLGLFAQNQKWEIATTLSGMLLAELQSYDGLGETNSQSRERRKRFDKPALLAFLAGLYLASYPQIKGPETLGFQLISKMTPPRIIASMWWKSTGCWILVWSANNSSHAHWLFTTQTAQYLGRISVGIYMIHMLLFHSLGLFLMANSSNLIGKDTPLQKTMGFMAAAIVICPKMFFLAEFFCKVIDEPCGKFSRWLETKITATVISDNH